MADETKRNDEELLATARKRFKQHQEEEKDLRDEAKLDFQYEAGIQWNEKQKADRENSGRPALTFNRMHTFVQQVSNEARQNKPQIKYVPAEDGDIETAKIYEGLARHIQYDSDAQVAYETALECSATGGFGYFKIVTEYCEDDGFDQEIKISEVPDPFRIYGVLVPSCRGEEPEDAFEIEDYTKEEYEAEFGDSETAKSWDAAIESSDGWVTEDRIRIANWYRLERTSKTISKGKRSRVVYTSKVKVYKINGYEILSETEYPASKIGIIPVLGKRRIIDGKPVLFSVIRFQRDPQQLINYYKSRIAETLATSPIQPYMVEEGTIPEQYMPAWAEMNRVPRPFLVYKSINSDGGKANPPQRQVFEAPIGALSQAAAQEIDDMKAVTGIYDASLGNRSNETTGIAIARRQQQSDITNMHFMDNLERAFKKGGVILAELIPIIYDTPRIVRIMGEDETAQLVKINQPFMDEKAKAQKQFKIGGKGVGEYDVIVTMGKAFSSKRQESFDMMGQVIQANPQILPMIGDILFKNSDLAGSEQLAERFKHMLPPNIQQAEGEKDGQQQVPPQVQAAMQQMQQQHQALNAYAQQVEQELKQYKDGTAAKAQLQQMQQQFQMQMRQVELEFEKWKIEYQANADLRNKLTVQDDAQEHETAMKSAEIGHETAMAEKSHQQGMETSQMGHEHALEMQANQPSQGESD